MKQYELNGEEYISDGVSMDVTITTGSLKECQDALAEESANGQYSCMQIDLIQIGKV